MGGDVGFTARRFQHAVFYRREGRANLCCLCVYVCSSVRPRRANDPRPDLTSACMIFFSLLPSGHEETQVPGIGTRASQHLLSGLARLNKSWKYQNAQEN